MAPDPSLTPEQIHARAFTVGFRGFDQSEVRDFLNRLAAEIRSLREQNERLESSWRSAEERAARPPVLDEDTLMAAVGEETAAILRAARASAAELRTKAGEDAERIRGEAEGLLAEKTKEAEQAAAAIVAEAEAAVVRINDKARAEAQEIRAKAEQERALTIDGANSTRERILDDLNRRRRVATVQIEQLRAGRERLLESYGVVRRTLEEAHEDLTRADAEARAAADEVGRKLQREYAGTEGPTPTSAPFASSGAAAQTLPAQPPQTSAEVAEEAEEDEGGVPHLRVVPDPDAEAAGAIHEVAAKAGSSKSPVDQLFAKIRSGGKAAGEAAKAGQPEKASEAKASEEKASEAGAGEAETPEPVVEAEHDAAGAVAGVSVEDDGAPGGDGHGDEIWLQRREGAMANLESSLTRKLKRALQDEQNDLLDRLRGLRGEITSVKLLPASEAHMERYSKAAMPLVAQAAVAGAAFAADVLGKEDEKVGKEQDLADLAGRAAESIVEPLRRRLEQAVDSHGGDDQQVLVESLGAAYREWKSQRIERVAGDALSAAFSRGTWNAVPEGSPLRWVADDIDGPCPDCDDDALAGSTPKGESFPTGQPHPPAHPGCRCLLVPVTA